MERAIPTFPCRDLDSASAFYQSLGFHLGARYPTYAILQRGALELHLSLFEALEPKTNCSAAYLRLEDAQALHRQAAALGLGGQGIPRITALEDQPWGMREFALVDPDGNLLRVGQELDATPEQHRVRLASGDDVPAVAALWQANVREAGETLDAGDQQAIQALLLAASRNRLLWLAEAQQHPRGFVLAHLWQIEDGQARVGEIAELYVLPQARRQGLARELVGSAEEALRSRGAGLIRAQSALDAPLSNLFWQGLAGTRLPDLHSLLTWGASSCATSCWSPEPAAASAPPPLCSPPNAAMRSSSTICATARPPKRCASASSARAAKPGGGGRRSEEGDVERLFAAIDERFGRLDVLVNNAGMLEAQTRLENIDAARLHRVFATNVTGSFLCAREAVKRLSTRHGGRGGSIVNVSSMASRLGSPNEYIDYAAAKGAIDSMTIGLAREVAAEGIRVNAVRPGLIDTEIHASGGEPGRIERLKGGIPLGRGGTAEEVARAILWLASDEASYSTGTFIDVSGGR